MLYKDIISEDTYRRMLYIYFSERNNSISGNINALGHRSIYLPAGI